MPLPILKSPITATDQDLVRFFHKIELEWSRHLGEETVLDCGTAITNAALENLCDANRILDASLPTAMTANAALDEAQRHFTRCGSKCRGWIMNSSTSPEQTQPLVEHLQSLGYAKSNSDVMYLPHLPQKPIAETAGLSIIPARASFGHVRKLADEEADARKMPKWTEAALLHLDDPHFDALLAIRDGVPVAFVGVLIVGELAGIQSLFVSEKFRRQGIGRTMMSRALEICMRSLSRHILLRVDPKNIPAGRLFESIGFGKVGNLVEYLAKDTA